MIRPSILIVEDEKDTATLIRFSLEKEGFSVLHAFDGISALELARTRMPEAIILDLMIPGLNGWQVLSGLKGDSLTSGIPVLILTAKTEVNDRVRGLEAGARDYVPKPFSPRELVARVKTAVRSGCGPERSHPASEGSLVLDRTKLKATLGGRLLPLSAMEFEILSALASQPGKVFPKENLLEALWSNRVRIDDRLLDVMILSLRRKIERDPKDPEYILTIRGVGYQFDRGLGATARWAV